MSGNTGVAMARALLESVREEIARALEDEPRDWLRRCSLALVDREGGPALAFDFAVEAPFAVLVRNLDDPDVVGVDAARCVATVAGGEIHWGYEYLDPYDGDTLEPHRVHGLVPPRSGPAPVDGPHFARGAASLILGDVEAFDDGPIDVDRATDVLVDEIDVLWDRYRTTLTYFRPCKPGP